MKARAPLALLLVFIFADTRRQSGGAAELYVSARREFDQGEIERAIAVATEGRRRFGDDLKWRELFTTVIVDSLGRTNEKAAREELDRTPHSGDAEAAVRRLMAEGYVSPADVAAPIYAKADRLARLTPWLRAEIAVRRAGPAFHNGDADEVERLSREALKRVDKASQPYVLANALGMLAAASMMRGDYQLAIERYDRGMRYARAVKATGTKSKMLGNFAWSYMMLGDFEEAKACFEEARAISVEQGDVVLQAMWLGNIAGVAIAQQKFEQALQPARESVATARRVGNETTIAATLSNLAQVEIELKSFENARQHNDEALVVWRKNQNASETTYGMLNAARIEAGTGRIGSAIQMLTSIATSSDDALSRLNAQAFMGRIYRDQGQPHEAERMFETALNTGDNARLKSKNDEAYLFAFESNLIRFYDEYIDLLLAGGRAVDALRLADRSRARTLRTGIGLVAPPMSSPTALARRHKATILCYWLAPRRSLLWVVTSTGVSVRPLPAADEIEKKIDAYRREIIAGRASVDSTLGAGLFQTLVARVPPSDRFIIVADGPLNALNLEALVVPASKPHYWIKDATLSYAPSLHFLGAPAEHRPLRDAHALVVGDVPAQQGFPKLAHAGREIEKVARHFAKAQQLVLEGEAATPAAYLTANLMRFSYVHFVAHGTASVRSPLDSSVILAGGGRLTGREIINAPLRAEVVTISSCNSAGRRRYAGEGLVGLSWAFLRAGARRVVAAQWDVSDTATPALMDQMYTALDAGDDPATALRQAKLGLLNSNTPHARPVYWAPFILYGAP